MTRDALRIEGAGLTHVGYVRERNEDAIMLDPEGELWVVADGMGGYGHGDVASSMVVDGFAEIPETDDPQTTLRTTIQQINAAIYGEALRADQTMGTTVVAALIQNDIAHLVWVGDSRIYLWRDGSLRQVTTDHSYVQELVDAGLITPADAFIHPERNIVTRALGIADTVEVAQLVLPLMPGDQIMLCSDGLTTCVTDDHIATILGEHSDLNRASSALVQAALDAGAPDNISVIVFAAMGQ